MTEQTQSAAHNGFSAVLQPWSDLNTGWIAIAFELTDYSAHVFNTTAAVLKQVAFASTIKDDGRNSVRVRQENVLRPFR